MYCAFWGSGGYSFPPLPEVTIPRLPGGKHEQCTITFDLGEYVPQVAWSDPQPSRTRKIPTRAPLDLTPPHKTQVCGRNGKLAIQNFTAYIESIKTCIYVRRPNVEYIYI